LKHQSILPDTLKEATQGITTSFQKALIDGKPWIVQQFQNVPNDIADTLRREFPYRSVELLPLTDPETGKQYSKIIRSTAFLDKFTPPAVPGQNPNLVVEFQGEEEPLIRLTTTGVNIMPDNKQDKSVDVSELQQMKETLTAQTKALAELQAKVAKTEEDRERAIELAKEQEAKNQKLEKQVSELSSDNYLKELSRLRKKDGLTYQVSPAYLEIVKPIIEQNGVVELADGQNQQEAMFKLFDHIAEMGSNVLLQLSLEGEKSYSQPEAKPDKNALIQELMEKEGISENDAWVRITNELHEYNIEV
jgi:hypothetical protein